ncbi:hypothetical protein C0993_003573 [Termitomyces sp. T159_Od127]|nr:hypothetical protein C0993_003573 [Termitomyces sp. T159_Od127]
MESSAVPLYEYINNTILTLLHNHMTEYDYSPEAYERYMETQQRISKWVATTEGYRNEYGNALTLPPSQTGSSIQPIGQLPGPQSLRSSHSQYIQKALHSEPHVTTPRQRSAVDLGSQMQRSNYETSSRSSAPYVSPQSQQPRRVSQHVCSTNVHTAPSQHRAINPTKTSTTYVAVSHSNPSQHRDTHTTVKTSTTHAAVSAGSHPQKPLIPSRHTSIQPEAHAQHSQDHKVTSHRSIASASPLQKVPLGHHASTPQLDATCQAPPTYMLTIPPSEKPTYVYAPSGWVPSAGLVIVPSKGRSTSIVVRDLA